MNGIQVERDVEGIAAVWREGQFCFQIGMLGVRSTGRSEVAVRLDGFVEEEDGTVLLDFNALEWPAFYFTYDEALAAMAGEKLFMDPLPEPVDGKPWEPNESRPPREDEDFWQQDADEIPF